MSHNTLMEYIAEIEMKREVIRERYVAAIEDELHMMIVHEALSCVRRAHEWIFRLAQDDLIVSSYSPEMVREELKRKMLCSEINIPVFMYRLLEPSAARNEILSAAVNKANATIQALREDIPLLQFKAKADSDKFDFEIVWV